MYAGVDRLGQVLWHGQTGAGTLGGIYWGRYTGVDRMVRYAEMDQLGQLCLSGWTRNGVLKQEG